MAIPKVYRWDDGNAPVLSGAAGAAYNVLKKCLVEGYGDKTPAGWTLEFENVEGTKGVFRSNPLTGNGFYLVVNDPELSAYFSLQGAELVTDINTLLGPFSTNFISAFKSIAANTTSRKWAVVATDKFFYFILNYVAGSASVIDYAATSTNNNYSQILFFGDFIKYTEEGFNSVLGRGTCHNATSYGYSFGFFAPGQSIGGGGSGYLFSPRSLGGVNAPTSIGFMSGGGPHSMPAFHSNTYRTRGSSSYSPDKLWLSGPVVLFDADTIDIRGELPGWRYPCHNYTLLVDQDLFLTTLTSGGRDFLWVTWGGTYSTGAHFGCNYGLIELSDWP